MKKVIKNIGIYLVGMLLFVACFDDDSNYDYLEETNKILFGYPYKGSAYSRGWGSYDAYVGEPVIFIPQIENDSLIDTTLYRWEYHVQPYGLVCTTRVMNVTFPDITTAQTLNGIVRAINTETGISYKADLVISILNKWDKGWLVLTNHNNTSKLNLLKTKDTVWVEDSDLTQMISQHTLGTGPRKLIFNTNQRTEVRVLQDGDDEILQNLDYHSLGTFASEFNDGSYPSDFVPKSFTSAGNVAAVQGEDGRVFIRTFNSAAVYTAEKWFDLYPLRYDGRTLNVQYLLGTPYQTSNIKNPMLYDADSSRFYILVGNGFNANTGKVLPVTINDESLTVPTPNNLSAFDMVYCQMVNSSGVNNEIFSILKEKETGDYFYYRFKVNTNTLTMLYAKDIEYYPVPAEIAALMKEGTKYMMPPTTTSATKSHLFIVSPDEPNKLYVTNTVMKDLALLEEYKTFDANITAMNVEVAGTLDKLTLGLGLKNGKFYLLNVSLSVLDDLVGMDTEKVIWEEQMEGEIVDLFQKNK